MLLVQNGLVYKFLEGTYLYEIMSSNDVDKTLKEKEPKTPPAATSQVFVGSFCLFLFWWLYFIYVMPKTFCCLLQEQSSTTTGTPAVNPEWANYQVFGEKVFVIVYVLINVKLGFWSTSLSFYRHILLYLHLDSWHQVPKPTHICGVSR
jgi:hypothetical protein